MPPPDRSPVIAASQAAIRPPAEEAVSIGDGLFRNPYVVAWPNGSQATLKSVLSLEVLHCTWPIAEALLSAEGNAEALRARLSSRGIDDPDAVIDDACELGILLSEDQLREVEDFFGPWTWGPVARALMFGYQANSFADVETELATRHEREDVDTSLLPATEGELIPLPDSLPRVLAGILGRRRSRRAFAQGPIELAQLAACLRAGFGVTGEWVADNGRKLPLTAAPSSGGLNTYDAFVLSRAVDGLDSGTYCYLPQEDGLARVAGRQVAFDRLFGSQAWAAEAACAVVLVADLRRQASKYAFPTTVSATLIEAGARAEILLLQAEEDSLSAVLVGMAGVGAFDRECAAEAGIWGRSSMVLPVCAVLFGARKDNLDKEYPSTT